MDLWQHMQTPKLPVGLLVCFHVLFTFGCMKVLLNILGRDLAHLYDALLNRHTRWPRAREDCASHVWHGAEPARLVAIS